MVVLFEVMKWLGDVIPPPPLPPPNHRTDTTLLNFSNILPRAPGENFLYLPGHI